MSGVSITKRVSKTTGTVRYVVRYRLGGREYEVISAGSFGTKKEPMLGN